MPSQAHRTVQALARAISAVQARVEGQIILADLGSIPPYANPDFGDCRVKVTRFAPSLPASSVKNTLTSDKPSDLYLFLDRHCLVSEQTLSALLDCCQIETAAGLAVPVLTSADGSWGWAGLVMTKAGPAALRQRPCQAFPPAVSLSQELQAVSGACMLVKKKLLDDIGGFEASSAMPDVDLCLRARQRGWRVFCVRGAPVICLEPCGETDRKFARIWNRCKFKKQWNGRYCLDDLAIDAWCASIQEEVHRQRVFSFAGTVPASLIATRRLSRTRIFIRKLLFQRLSIRFQLRIIQWWLQWKWRRLRDFPSLFG